MPAERAVERRIVTVLFADLVGFTALSERLDAEDVALVQDAYFDAVRETITRHGGLLEKFIGDAAMAVFGAARARDDDAERSVRAGLALVAAVERLGASFGFENGLLQLRVGINTGEAIYGEATAERGPVTGDAVNVAARLQAAADPSSVVVGDVTALAVADVADLEQLPAFTLKGKAEPVAAWRVVRMHAERSRERALGALRAPTLGREGELSLLLGAVGSGAGRVVVVAPPGVGKTRLLETLAERVARSGGCVLRARLKPDVLAPFEPVGDLVRSAGDLHDLLPRLLNAGIELARAHVVAGALGTAVAPSSRGAGGSGLPEDRDRLFGAWLQGLDALTAGAPAVWLVEDVHWASGDLLAFLDAAGRATSLTGRLVVASARPVLLDNAAEWCAAGELLHLPPLPPVETAQLVRALVGDALPSELVEQIAERSAGNALFVEELLRTWVSVGVLSRGSGGSWTLATLAADVPLPPTVQAIYAGQLDDLPGPARTAARRASVAGRSFPFDALDPLGVESADEALATLTRQVLVTGPHDDSTLGASYAFRHALLRDVGYASLSRSDRARLHARLADWLASLSDDVLPTLAEVIARHYAAALDSSPSLARDIDGRSPDELEMLAASWFDRAADVAFELAAWASARALAARSLELTHDERRLDRARRLQRLANATANAVGAEGAATLLRDALEAFRAARPENDAAARVGIAEVGSSLGYLWRAQAQFVAGEELAEELLVEIGTPDDVSTARLLALRAIAVLSARDDYDGARKDADRALALARSAGDDLLELETLQLIAQIEAERGDTNEEPWLELEELGRLAGRWDTVAHSLQVRAGIRVDDHAADALPLYEAVAEVCATRGLVESGAWCDYGRAEAHFVAGRWDEAIDVGLRAVEEGESHEFHRVVVRSWFVLLPIASARDRRDLAERAYPRFAARRDLEAPSPYARIISTAAHLRFAAFGLEPPFVPEVEERLGSFDFDHGGPSWLSAVETVVDSWLDAGDLDGAERALDRMRASLERRSPSRLARATEATLRARLLLLRGGKGAAEEAERALEQLGDNAPWWRSKAIHVLADAGGASEPLVREATAIVERLGISG